MASSSSSDSDGEELSSDLLPKDSLTLNSHPIQDVSDDSDSDDKMKSMYNIFNPYHVPGRHKLRCYAAEQTNSKTPDSTDIHERITLPSTAEGEGLALDKEEQQCLRDKGPDPSSVHEKVDQDEADALERTSDLEKIEVANLEERNMDDGKSLTEEIVETKDSLLCKPETDVVDNSEGKTNEDAKQENDDVSRPDVVKEDTDAPIAVEAKFASPDSMQSNQAEEGGQNAYPFLAWTNQSATHTQLGTGSGIVDSDEILSNQSEKRNGEKSEGEANRDCKLETDDTCRSEAEKDPICVSKATKKKVRPPIPPKPKTFGTKSLAFSGASSELTPVQAWKSLNSESFISEQELAGSERNIMDDESDTSHEKIPSEKIECAMENKDEIKMNEIKAENDMNDSNNALLEKSENTNDEVVDAIQRQEYSIDEAMDIRSPEKVDEAMDIRSPGKVHDGEETNETENTELFKQTGESLQAEKGDEDQPQSISYNTLITDTMMADESLMMQSSGQQSITSEYTFVEATPSLMLQIGNDGIGDWEKSLFVKPDMKDGLQKDSNVEESIDMFDNSDDDDSYESANEDYDGRESEGNDRSESDDSDPKFDDEANYYQTSLSEFSKPPLENDKEDQNETKDNIEIIDKPSEQGNGGMSISSRASSSSSIVVLHTGSYPEPFRSISSKVSEGDLTSTSSFEITGKSDVEIYRKEFIEQTTDTKLDTTNAVVDELPETFCSVEDVKLEMKTENNESLGESFAVFSQVSSSDKLVDVRTNLTEHQSIGKDDDKNTLSTTDISKVAEGSINIVDECKRTKEIQDLGDRPPPPVAPKSLEVRNYIASMNTTDDSQGAPKPPPRTGRSSPYTRQSMPASQSPLPSAHRPAATPSYSNLAGDGAGPQEQAQNQDNTFYYLTGQPPNTYEQTPPMMNIPNMSLQQWYTLITQWQSLNQQSLPTQQVGPHGGPNSAGYGQSSVHTPKHSEGQGQSSMNITNDARSLRKDDNTGQVPDAQHAAKTDSKQKRAPSPRSSRKTDKTPSNTSKHSEAQGQSSMNETPSKYKHAAGQKGRTAPSNDNKNIGRVGHDAKKKEDRSSRSQVSDHAKGKPRPMDGQRKEHVQTRRPFPRKAKALVTKDRPRSKDSRKSSAADDVRPKDSTEKTKTPVPIKAEECYLFISEMSPNTNKENLMNFVEAKIHFPQGTLEEDMVIMPDKVIFDRDNGRALIVLPQKPDMEQLFSEIRSKQFAGAYLNIKEVEPPTHIAVSCKDPVKQPQSLILYFESKHIGDGEISEPVRESEDGSCFIIKLEDKKMVERVCKIDFHEFGNQVFRVSPCYEFEDEAIWDPVIHPIPKAEPIEIKPPPEHFRFLKRCRLRDLETDVGTKYGEVELEDESIRISCTLTPKIPDFKALINSWPQEMTDVVNTFMTCHITEKAINLLEECEVWNRLIASVTFTDEENLNVLQDNVQREVRFTGRVEEVTRKHNETMGAVEAIRRELRRKTEFKQFDEFKFALLVSIGTIEEIQRQFDDTKITTAKGGVTVEGQAEDIQSVLVKIFENLDSLVVRQVDHRYSSDCVQFATVTKTVMTKIKKALDSADYKVEWALERGKLKVCCQSSVSPSDVANLIFAQIDEVTIDTDVEMRAVLGTDEWLNFSTELTETYTDVGHHQQRDVVVYGYAQQVKVVAKKIKTFLDENAQRKLVFQMDPVKIQFIKKHRLDKIKDDLKNLGVDLTFDGKLNLTSNKDGLALARQLLDNVGNNIVCETHQIKKIGVLEVFTNEKKKGTIDTIETNTSCLIRAPNDESYDFTRSTMSDQSYDSSEYEGAAGGEYYTADGPSEEGEEAEPDDKNQLKCKNGICISLVRGEIGNEAADVLVATCAQNLDLNLGGASKSLLTHGGPTLQQELKTDYKEIKNGDLVKIKGGQLECSQVYLTCLPNWTSDNDCSTLIQKFMADCLKTLAKKKKRSIMFSALGTGQLKYPHARVAQLMFQAVIDFDSKTTNSSVKEVMFIMYPRDRESIQAFEGELKCLKDGGGVRPSYGLQMYNVHVEMVIEDIAIQKVDAILCSSSEDMNLSRSGAASALLRVGGKALQDGANTFKNTLKAGEIGKIGGAKLACKAVFLTVLPVYTTESNEVLEDTIGKFLTLCASQGYKTVAIPAMGTGFLKYPEPNVSRAMCDAISKWSRENPQGSVTSVRLVMHAKDYKVIDAFKVQIKQRQGVGLQRKSRRLTERSISREDFGKQGKYRMFETGCFIDEACLTVKVGDLLNEKVDAIVSSLGKPCEFLGAVAQVLIKKCPKVVDKCKKDGAKLSADGVLCTKSYGGIPADYIILVHFQESLTNWQKHILKCLEKANDKGIKSLAFPVLGTGAGNVVFKPDEIAGSFFSAMDTFVSNHSSKKPLKLKDVRVVIYSKQSFMQSPFLTGIRDQANKTLQSGKGKGILGGLKEKVTGFFMGKSKDQSNRAKQTNVEKSSTLSLEIYSDDAEHIKNCKAELDSKLDEAYTKLKIDTYKDLVKCLTKEELALLEDSTILANIKIDTTNGIITIEGPNRPASDAMSLLHTKLRDIERKRREAEEAETLYVVVKWHFEEITQNGVSYEEYDKYTNYRIENAYKDGKKSVKLEDNQDGTVYVIDFENMVEYPEQDKNSQAKVIRKDIIKAGAYNIPASWDPMGDKENIKLVNLQPNVKEYTDVESAFITQAKSGPHAFKIQNVQNIKVSKIERIQNTTLYQQYQAKRKQMETAKPNLPANMPLERSLWHGTGETAVASIQRHGFNRGYCGKNGTWFGSGVYFAADASYSARPWLAQGQQTPSAPPGQNKGYIFYCKVLTGQYLKGDKTMRYLPPVDASKDKTLLYDSAVDDPANPMEFVIFHDTQAYPEYIITFLL